MSTATPTSPAVPTTITNLTPAASVNNSDLTVIVQNGVTKSALASQLAAVAQANTIVAGTGISVSTVSNVSTITNTLSTLTSADILVGNASNIATAVAVSGDATLANTGAVTLATVNSNVGSFTNSNITVNSKGLITAASSGTVSASPVVGNFKNLTIGISSATVCGFTFDEGIVETALGGTAYKVLGSSSSPLNIAITGAGGMDTGAASANTVLYIYAIYNPTTLTLAALGTLAGGGSTIYSGSHMPSGYTASALISAICMNGSAQFNNFIQIGNIINIIPAAISTGANASVIPPNAKTVSGYASQSSAGSTGKIAELNTTTIGAVVIGSTGTSTTTSGAFYNIPIITASSVYITGLTAFATSYSI
jgi:hypothetical protein